MINEHEVSTRELIDDSQIQRLGMKLKSRHVDAIFDTRAN